MFNIIRNFNQNRKMYLEILLVIVFVFIVLGLINNMTKENKNNTRINSENATRLTNDVISDKSAVSGQEISKNRLNKETEAIKNFLDYCNDSKVDLAYEMITEDCKNAMFPTVDDFNKIYYSKLFDVSNKQFAIENWSQNVYKIQIMNDILSTGQINNNATKTDYITVISEGEDYKLNINNYVSKKNINKSTEKENIKIMITDVDTYMDYEIYNLTIENNSDNKIMLDTGNDSKNVYLLDSNDMKYYFYNNEIIENQMIISSKYKTNVKIKFSNKYSSNRKIEQLVFSKLILDYDKYKENQDKYNEFYMFEINL